MNILRNIYSSYREFLHKYFHGTVLFWIGFTLVAIVSLGALFASIISPYDPNAKDIANMLQAPSYAHPLGTDLYGRDVLSRLLHGGRVSLWVGFVAVGISSTIGIILGLMAGYMGRVFDEIIMRFVDIMLCFPSFFLILTVIAFLEPSLFNIMVIIGLTSWMGITRLVRAETLSLKRREFVASAVSSGASTARILGRHILPNALNPIIVSGILGVAGAILTESSLSFLGLGVQAPHASWGNMLMEGKEVLSFAWWLSFFPGFAILITVLGYNLLGEALRDMLDPRLQS